MTSPLVSCFAVAPRHQSGEHMVTFELKFCSLINIQYLLLTEQGTKRLVGIDHFFI